MSYAQQVAPTLEPAASVNLEYLLLALKVRKTARREPLFSLDPVDPKNLENCPLFQQFWGLVVLVVWSVRAAQQCERESGMLKLLCYV